MNQKDYFLLTGVIFSVIAAAHIARLIFSWEASIAGYTVPVWFSFIVSLFAGFLAYTSFKLRK